MSDGISDTYRSINEAQKRDSKIAKLKQTNKKAKELCDEIEYHQDSARYHLDMVKQYTEELNKIIAATE